MARRKFKSKGILGWILILFLIASAICAFSLSAILSQWDAEIEDPDSIDVLIVLGSGVWGTEPSPQLRLRLETALDVINANPDMTVIVSGGQGPDEGVSEAAAMSTYLMDHGACADSIILEDQSTSTVENLTFSKAILDSLDLESPRIAIVTTDFHMYRAKMIARRLGMEAQGQSAPNVPIIRLKNTAREVLALIKDTMIIE
jgi:uncharacterized SAM-binding protein YcdF (DUF218 family)